MEPGLSSDATLRPGTRDHPAYSKVIVS